MAFSLERARCLRWLAMSVKASLLIVTSIACRVPPPPVSQDISRPWRREESSATRGLEVHRQNNPKQTLANDSDDRIASRLHAGIVQPFMQRGDDGCDSVASEISEGYFPANSAQPTSDDSDVVALTPVPATVDDFVSEVLRVNPNIEASENSWLAAMEMYPQATAFSDPAFRFMNGPTIFGSGQGQHLWRIQVAQRVPWYGKRGLMGEVADHQADVAYYRWRGVRQMLAGTASLAFGKYALAEQVYELSINDLQIAELLVEPAKIELVSTNTEALLQHDSQQLLLMELQRKREEIEYERQIAGERLNVMLHRDLDAPLPPVIQPARLADFPNEQHLIGLAIRNSPELATAKSLEEQAAVRVALAEKEFYPDLDIVGRFDTVANDFWAPDRANIRPQLGIYLPLMVQQNKRWAKLREMKFEHRRRQAESRQVTHKITSDIQRSVAQLKRSQHRIASIERMLATAERRAEAEQTLVSKNPSRSKETLTAQRTLIKFKIDQAKELNAFNETMIELHVIAGTILDNTIGNDDEWVDTPPLAANE